MYLHILSCMCAHSFFRKCSGVCLSGVFVFGWCVCMCVRVCLNSLLSKQPGEHYEPHVGVTAVEAMDMFLS